jgi:hypothetical protein
MGFIVIPPGSCWVALLSFFSRIAVVGWDLKSEFPSPRLLRVSLRGLRGLTSIVLLKTVYCSPYSLYL